MARRLGARNLWYGVLVGVISAARWTAIETTSDRASAFATALERGILRL